MKGSLGDLYYLMIILIITIIVAVVCMLVVTEMDDIGFFNITANASEVKTSMDTSFDVLDYGIPTAFVISCLFIVIAVYFIRSHPLLFVASLIVMMIMVFATAPIVNAVINVMSADELVAYSNQFPVTVAFIQNLPLIVLIFSCMIAISLYAKPGGEQNV